VTVAAPAELVERIWAHDSTLWTGDDEAQWLGWLDEPVRMRERLRELLAYAGEAANLFDDVVLLGMGGSSLAPLVLARSFGAERFHVLDTTHPVAVRRLGESLDLARTLFIVSSKSGSTIETRSHFDYFRAQGGAFVAVTDPGSSLDGAEGLSRVFPGEPTIGGRYSALSQFGLVPAALMGVDLERLLDRAEEMREACRLAEGNPGLELGLQLAETPIVRVEGDFGLWVEQLLAESTGKEGKGIVPVREGGEPIEVRLPDPYELGQEFFRWEFATAVAGAQLGINPFDQPDVQAAKDRTQAVLASGAEPALEAEGDLDALLESAIEGDWVAIQAFVDPEREGELEPLVARVRERGLPLAVGLGPRYLHSTGQLHKGGPNTVIAVQVVDDPGEELPIPGRDFGFRRLIRAQAAGDYEALLERGRRVCRVTL
jgi:transaldolase / glucose-6-phosphate isomerase